MHLELRFLDVVCEFHYDDKVRLLHYNDLKCTTLTLFNAIVEGLRKGRMPSFVDTVLNALEVIEETTLMREQLEIDESTCKRELVSWHLSDDRKMCTTLKAVESFRVVVNLKL